jgi:ferredoxin
LDGSGDKVAIIADRCLGCGRCIRACSRQARAVSDDSEAFFREFDNLKPLVVIIAPSAVTVFDDIFRVISFLKSSGVLAVFDVSFGAELSAKSYIEYARKEAPPTIISPACPVIVNYCELYAPNLIPYLAPAHSPMLHTAIMIKEYFPALAGAKIAALSPCTAKKREFEETGHIDFNVTLLRFKEIVEQRNINLNDFSPLDFDGPMAERAVSFSSPGGLKKTIVRDFPALSPKIRRIEGSAIVYEYLNDIPRMLEENAAPFLIDCLSCSAGCNGGVATGNLGLPFSVLETKVDERTKEQRRRNKLPFGANRVKGEIRRYWKPGIYNRTYKDCSSNLYAYKTPTQKDLDIIYYKMKKTVEDDFLNCSACGYGSCKSMAEAIFNKQNRVENCQLYLKKEIIERLEEHESILRYIREGVFLLENGGHIMPSYSKSLEEIFRRDMLAGLPIMTVFSGFFSNKKLKKISQFMDRAFDAALPDKEFQKENPLKEVDAMFPNLDGGFDTHRLHFYIDRIGDENRIERLLVIVRDSGMIGSSSNNEGVVDGGSIFKFDKIKSVFHGLEKDNELKVLLFNMAEKCLLFCSQVDGGSKKGESISFDAAPDYDSVRVSCVYSGAEADTDKVVAGAVSCGLITAAAADGLSDDEKLNLFPKVAFFDMKDKLKALSCQKIQFSNKNGFCRLSLVFPEKSI